MSLPQDPARVTRKPVKSPPASPRLGWIALWLGVATVLFALVLVVYNLAVPLPPLYFVSLLAVPAGIAAIVVGIIAIVKQRGRRQGIFGLALALAAGPVAWLVGVLYILTMIKST